MPIPPPSDDQVFVPLHEETVTVNRRSIETARVAVHLRTTESNHLVDETLGREHVVIERVPIGRIVDVAPTVRDEGDVTIIPVVEEVVVVERRLMLKEEVRLRRVRSSERHQETVVIRRQEAEITETPAGPRGERSL